MAGTEAGDRTRRISIAMATYNGAPYVRAQLESFVSQTRLPDELVVSDDRSRDETLQIVERFSETAPFEVKILANRENVGHELNFERAIAACTGDLIFLSDQDDIWLPHKLTTVEALFEQRPDLSVVVNDLEITDGQLQPTGHTVLGQIRASGILGKEEKGLVIGCASAFRKELLALLLPIPPLNYGHDRWLHAIGQAIGGRHVLDQTLQLYRRHGGNASTWLFDGAEPPGWSDMLNAAAGQDLARAYANQREVLRTIESRMVKLGSAAYRGAWPFDRAIRELRRGQAALANRMRLLDAAFLGRKFRALLMLIRGDYRYFLGWRSFAKDLIR